MFILIYAIMEIESVSARYEKIWNNYLSALTTKPGLPLRSFLRLRHIGIPSFEMWMSRKGLSARQAKAQALSLQPELSNAPSGTSFLPVVFHEESCLESQSCDILTGISLTLPDGAVISIRRGTPGAVVSFLRLYSGEGSPCSD